MDNWLKYCRCGQGTAEFWRHIQYTNSKLLQLQNSTKYNQIW